MDLDWKKAITRREKKKLRKTTTGETANKPGV